MIKERTFNLHLVLCDAIYPIPGCYFGYPDEFQMVEYNIKSQEGVLEDDKKLKYNIPIDILAVNANINQLKDLVPKSTPIDPIVLKNNCFSTANTMYLYDERQAEWKKQRLERGFDNTELWNLYFTIARFVYPRIKEYSKYICHHPREIHSMTEWEKMVKKMVDAFEYIAKSDDDGAESTPQLDEKHHEGIKLFAEYFYHLWL